MKITIYNQFKKAQIGKVDFLKNIIVCAIDSFENDLLHLQFILKTQRIRWIFVAAINYQSPKHKRTMSTLP